MIFDILDSSVTQWAECQAVNLEVVGSNPTRGAIASVTQRFRVSPLQGEGQWFESTQMYKQY